jgi:hypothetical protein
MLSRSANHSAAIWTVVLTGFNWLRIMPSGGGGALCGRQRMSVLQFVLSSDVATQELVLRWFIKRRFPTSKNQNSRLMKDTVSGPKTRVFCCKNPGALPH